MADTGNQRYLQYILLLGEGGLLVLKGLFNRELQKTGQSLLPFIQSNSERLRRLSDHQYETLFPPGERESIDINTWDISLISLLILKLFGKNLTAQDRNAISNIRNYRNEYIGHKASFSFDEDEYKMNCDDLTPVLLQLAKGIGQETYTKCQQIIKKLSTVNVDVKSALQELRNMHDFSSQTLAKIEKSLGTTVEKLDNLFGEMATEQHSNDELKDIKKDANEIKDVIPKLTKEMEDIKEKLKDLVRWESSSSNVSSIEQVVDVLFHVSGKSNEKIAEAEDVIVKCINDILLQIRRIDNRESFDEDQLRQKVQTSLKGKSDAYFSLYKAVLELVLSITCQPDTEALLAKRSSIILKIRCRSFKGLLELLQYLSCESFCQKLQRISDVIGATLGISVTLSAFVTKESLKMLSELISTADQERKTQKGIQLPLSCRSGEALAHTWTMFGEGKAKHHFDIISKEVSRVVGDGVEVTASVSCERFKRDLQKLYDDMDTKPTQTVQCDSSKNRKEVGIPREKNSIANGEEEIRLLPSGSSIKTKDKYKRTWTRMIRVHSY